MFIWLFHRISGAILIALIAIKTLTGFWLLPKEHRPDWALSLHRHPVIDILILILFTFHSVYGIRTIIIDLGFRREKLLFWISNITAAIISIILIGLYFRFA
jgi:succinate dehydrogenase/fumarate reductase cytochrome b subunit